MDDSVLKRASDNIRLLAVSMVEKAKSGHPGGPMGGADFMSVLYSEFLQFDPDDMRWPNRDRFVLDAGHLSAMLYSTLALCGKYSMDELKQFRQWESPTPGHPERDVERGVENTSGPLGQGTAMAVGIAIAERFMAARFGEWLSHKTYCYVSDGGIQEEISHGAGRIAGHLGLSNLIMFYDANDVQLSTKVDEVTSEDTAKKYEAWGWRTEVVDGHDIGQLRAAIMRAREEKEKPSLIIGKTIMGKGALDAAGKPFEGKVEMHGQPVSQAGGSYELTVKNLGGDPSDPFVVFPEVADAFRNALEEKRREARRRKEEQVGWEGYNPDLAKKYHDFLSGSLPGIDFGSIAHKANDATRNASKDVLAELAKKAENIIVSSADLSNSDKTDGFLKNTKQFSRGDFSGAFLQSGVSELTMAGIMNGVALHGGIIPVCGTFFAFSDFQKPQIRLACIMELPVIYVWTHDAFRVGEDGPTHQPIEQEAQVRLLEKVKNLSGRRSMLVLRPADSAETSVAWKMAIENTQTPTALILSRQNINDIPALGESRYMDALGSEKGAYVVLHSEEPDVILVADGSEVSTLVDAAKIIEKDGFSARVVSAISEGIFREQPKEYQESIIPKDVPVFGLTAGLPVTMQGFVRDNGTVMGMTRFGASAPAKVLDEKFGFTPHFVATQIVEFLRAKN